MITIGCEINSPNEYRETPLHRAAYNDHDSIAGLLLKNGKTLVLQ